MDSALRLVHSSNPRPADDAAPWTSPDLPSPATAIRALAQLALLRHEPAAGITPRQPLHASLNRILTLARLAQLPFILQPVGLRTAASDACRRMEHERKGRQLVLDIDAGHLCHADPLLLQQVLANLLSNAFRATRTRATPSVTVGSRLAGNELILCVSDNGIGLPASDEQLFHPLQRSPAAGHFAGLGVGLAIVKVIAERQGGRAWARPGARGGAEFCVSLPL